METHRAPNCDKHIAKSVVRIFDDIDASEWNDITAEDVVGIIEPTYTIIAFILTDDDT